jgi:hypothetical protein
MNADLTSCTPQQPVSFWSVAEQITPLLELGLLTVTAFIAYKSLVAWRDQAEFQSRREAAKEIFRSATKCSLWLIEARQSGSAPKEFLLRDISQRYGAEMGAELDGKLAAISADAFAKYLLVEKKSDFDELSMALSNGKKFFPRSEIDAIDDIFKLREAIIFHSDALVDSEFAGVSITNLDESRAFCYRLGNDHSIEDRIERALGKAALL